MTRKRTIEKDSLAAPAAVPARRKAPAKPRVRRAETIAAPFAEVAATPAPGPTFQEIAALAYSYWEARGCQGGSPEEDWLRAEQELSTRVAAATA